MDITSDGFGFMLAVGDLTFVPFAYTLQARYLAFHHVELGPLRTLGVLFVNFLGYYIFRDANGEKNNFRNGKNPKSEFGFSKKKNGETQCSRWLDLKYMTTAKGSKLLTSGWWGRSRHPNYL
jgi:hypothetical protein